MGSPFFIRMVVSVLMMSVGAMARAETIEEVMKRSQEQRLASFELSRTGESVQLVRATFDRLYRVLGLSPGVVELHVVKQGTYAETLLGRFVVVNESLATLSEGERAFILAHELGHIILRHWGQMIAVYQFRVPGEVRQSETDAIAGVLGREASKLAHCQEVAADAYALQAIKDLGESHEVAVAAIRSRGMQHDTPTHPGTWKRLAALLSPEACEQGAPR